MKLQFEWDENKAAENFVKHGARFEDAMTVFGDPLTLTVEDAAHSSDEIRWVTVGQTASGELLVVFYVERGDTIRIISARSPTARERKAYEEEPF